MRVSLILLSLCCVCAGCVDPGADFEAFAGRVPPPHVNPTDAGGDAGSCSILPGDVTGPYLLAISVTLGPRTPILVLADVATPASGGGVGLTFDAQPLSAADRQTPVGQKISLGPFQVSESGAYRAEITGLEVAGAANPVTHGDIAASLVLAGNLCGDKRFFCGTVSGNVTKPIPLDLAGSTFTLTRVDSPGTLPARPAINCAGDLADAL